MMTIPEDVKVILGKLNNSGFTAYIVGGCVRDFLLDKNAKDWDIATSATPEEVENIFDKVIDHGREFGGVKVIYHGESYDITTYRSEDDYSDYRRPSIVRYSENIHDDLERRDYTINSIAYNEEEGVVDPFNGRVDIDNKLIRCVGNPADRFQEDPLRILRGVRLASDLIFEIDDATYKEMKNKSSLVKMVSKERIRNEFNRVIVSHKPVVGLRVLEDLDLFPYIFGDDYNGSTMDLDNKKIKNLSELEYILDDRLAYFFIYLFDHEGYSVDEIHKIMKFLKYSNITIKKVVHLVSEYPEIIKTNSEKDFKKIINRLGFADIKILMRLARELNKDNQKIKENIEDGEVRLSMFMGKHHPIFYKDLNVTGKDLLDAGISQGKEMGYIFNKLLEYVYLNPEENNKEVLIKMALEEKKVN